MSTSNEKPDPLFELLRTGGEAGGRIFQGLFSNPWTGIPTALLIMAQLDPSGKLTTQFLANLATFLSAIGKVAIDAAIALGQAIADKLPTITPPPPKIPLGTGNFCVDIDINEFNRFILSLMGGSLIPLTQQCFTEQGARDIFFDTLIRGLGPFAPLYNIRKVDK